MTTRNCSGRCQAEVGVYVVQATTECSSHGIIYANMPVKAVVYKSGLISRWSSSGPCQIVCMGGSASLRWAQGPKWNRSHTRLAT